MMVFLWWFGGGRCPLAGPYKPAGCLANFFLFFRIYFSTGATADCADFTDLRTINGKGTKQTTARAKAKCGDP
jgi:hypothetical protein